MTTRPAKLITTGATTPGLSRLRGFVPKPVCSFADTPEWPASYWLRSKAQEKGELAKKKTATAAERVNVRIIEHIPVNELKPYLGHAHTLSKRQIEKLSCSIRRFGVVAPILIDEANVIIARRR
jgi:hypothetical protein